MEVVRENRLHWADMVVITAYFGISLSVGVWIICRPNQNSMKGYFLAGRNMAWWPVGMSIFASNIGADNFVGMSGSAAASGIAVVQFEWMAVFLLILLGWIFLPVYCGSGIYTMPEYLQRRFGGERLRLYLCIIALANYIFSTLAVDLFTGALFIQQAVGWNLYVGVALMLLVAAVYCALGGLTTVILTDAMAVIVMVIGGAAVSIIGMVRVGGLEGLNERYMASRPNTSLITNGTCGLPRPDSLHILRGFGADFPWFGTLCRTFFGSLWFWCANQLLVQRTLASKNLTHARGGCILAAYLKLLPIILIVWPGMMSRALFPDEVGCADPETCSRVCGNPVGCSNIAYPKLVIELLPAGLRGLILAVMMAAVISTLTSLFNSSSTLVSMDIWVRLRPKAGAREILIVSRLVVLVMTVLAVMWIPIMQAAQGAQIYRYSTTIKGYLGAPTSIMFLLAILWTRTTEQGAFWGILISQIFGIVRFIVDIVYTEPPCGEPDNRPGFVKDFNGYDYTVVQMVVAFLAIVIISLITKPCDTSQYAGMTYSTRFEKTLKDYDIEHETRAKLEQTNPGRDVTDDNDEDKSENHDGEKTVGSTEVPVQAEAGSCIGCRQWWRSCRGLESDDESPFENYETRMDWMKQKPFWKNFLNVNALVVGAITIFLYGYFG